MNKDICPLCGGTGKGQTYNATRATIKALRAQGLTMRAIAKVVKKGTTTVMYHLNK